MELGKSSEELLELRVTMISRYRFGLILFHFFLAAERTETAIYHAACSRVKNEEGLHRSGIIDDARDIGKSVPHSGRKLPTRIRPAALLGISKQ